MMARGGRNVARVSFSSSQSKLSRIRAGGVSRSEGRVMLFWPRFSKAISLFFYAFRTSVNFVQEFPLFSPARRCDLRPWDRPPHPLQLLTHARSLPRLPLAPALPPFPPSVSVSLLGSLSSAAASSPVGLPHLSSSSQTTRRHQRIVYKPIMSRVGRR